MRHAPRLAPAALAALTLAACAGPAAPGGPRSDGSLGISPDGATLYAANPDQGTVSVIDATTLKVRAEVPVGRFPARIAVADDGRVFVSNRGSRSVSVLDPKTDTVTKTLATGAEPVGLALAADGKTVYVACFTGGEVDAIDTATGVTRWTAKVDHARGVALARGQVMVTAFKQGTVSFFDAGTGTATAAPVNLDQDPLTMQSRVGAPTDAEQAGAVVVAPGTAHAFVLDVEARDAAVATQSPDAYGGQPGASRAVPVVAAGLSTVNLDSRSLVRAAPGDLAGGGVTMDPAPPSGSGGGTPLTGTPPPGSFDATTSPPPVIATDGTAVLNAPAAAVADPGGHFLYAVFQGSDDLAILDTDGVHPDTDRYPGVWGVVSTGGQFPTGVALSADGKHLFVYNAHTYTVSEIAPNPAPSGVADRLELTRTVSVADAPAWLTPKVAEGRRLFFSATDPSLTDTSLGGISCASCHPEGRDDGRTWKFTEGPRNTPFLATGFLAETKPFHWAGEIADFHGFQQIVETRMGGAGLSGPQFDDVLAFLQSSALLHPDNPNLAPDGQLTALQQEGKQLFSGAAGCNVCHTGVTTTDNLNHDVGTWTDLTDPATGIDVTDMTHTIQTPTLHDVFTSGPYLHNGAAVTITQRLVDFRDDGSGNEVHGHTASLTAHQLEALVAYVKTL